MDSREFGNEREDLCSPKQVYNDNDNNESCYQTTIDTQVLLDIFTEKPYN